MWKKASVIFLVVQGFIPQFCGQVVFDDDPSQVVPQSKPFIQNQQGGFSNQNFQNQNQNGFGQGQVLNSNQNFQNQNFQNQNFRNPNQNFRNPNQNFQNPNQNFQNPNQNFQNPNQNFQNPNQNFQNPNQNFQNSNQNQGFSSSNFDNPNQFAQFQKEPEGFTSNTPTSKQPDCQTHNNLGGICTPLVSCDRIGRMLRNRQPIAAARLLQRSLCGFNGFLPNVCCPIGRNQFQDNSLGNDNFPQTQQTQRPVPVTNFPPTTPTPQTQRPVTTFPLTTPRSTFPPTFQTTRNPFGSGPVTLVPPKTTTIGNGGGLIIIGPTQAPQQGLSDVGLPPECGFSNSSHSRIVGGRAAVKGAWPWVAALGYKDDNGNVNYLCGGALISKDYLLTASHCVYKKSDLFSVRLGDHDLYTDSDGVVPLDIEVAQVILHPQYDPSTFYNDIALVKLKQPVPFSRQVHPICLPSTPQLRTQRFEDNTPFVAGWGATQFNGPSSSVLREVQLPVISDSICQEKFKTFKSVNVDSTNICAGVSAGGKDACQGDSGGPLMQPVGNNKYVLIGVVSFGFKCAEPGYPGVYSRVTTHIDWIENTIRDRNRNLRSF